MSILRKAEVCGARSHQVATANVILGALVLVACGGRVDTDPDEIANAGEEIVGGVVTAVDAWTPTVKIREDHGGGVTGHCDGTLIHPRWVLTAAHCVDLFEDEPSRYSFIIGRHDLNDTSKGEVILGAEVFLHANHSLVTHDSDIALVRLASASAQMTAEVVPPSQLAMLPNGTKTTLVGWGTTSTNGTLSSKLVGVDVQTMGIGDVCNDLTAWDDEITANQLCVGVPEGGKGFCDGDSGGPAWVRTDGMFRELGLSSFRHISACGAVNLPAAATLLPNFYHWIYDQLPVLEGYGWFFTTDGTGTLSSLAFNPGWASLSHAIVPGSFSGDSRTDLLFYHQRSGGSNFYKTDGTGHLQHVKTHSNWGSGWHTIVPGQFGGNSNTDLMLYDPAQGKVQFRTTDTAGNAPILKTLTGFAATWQTIVPGNFNGDSFTDLFFYDPTTGVGEFRTSDGAGNLALLRRHTGMRKTWNIIVPGQFGSTSHTDLLFYDQLAGQGLFYTTNGSGAWTLIGTRNGWRKSWQHIVPGTFNSDGFTDLLFTDAFSGHAQFYATNGAGNMTLLKGYTGIGGTFVIPGDFGGNSFSDVLFYHRWQG